ncbi:DUF1428 domain-containing protein [Pseudooceanicola sp.]|uniref:DUF1428 domain-containing protein n=1 Tax=Pseudooceanicola sp. TaxID=1914328 RepID=UPI0035C710C0
MAYVSGFVLAVPAANKEAYVDAAKAAWALFEDYGALSNWECWEEDVPDGELTSFPMAVKRKAGEVVVFSWIIWPDKATSDRCMASAETDPRWEQLEERQTMPFDGKRMIFGGFTPIFQGGEAAG